MILAISRVWSQFNPWPGSNEQFYFKKPTICYGYQLIHFMRVTFRLTYFTMHYSVSCIILQGHYEQIWITIFQYRKSPMQNIGTMQLDNQQSSWQSGRSPGDDGTSSHLTTSDTNDGFFERPVRIFSTQWEVGVTLYQEINPWKLFCEDPRVANRLAHFKNLKMNLHVQLLVNGNPFYYGRGIMYYNPLPNADSISRLTAPPERADLVEQTQRPHIYFDPTKSEGGEVVLPFVWPKAALDVPMAEWNAMGVITVKSMNPLQHANGATEPITITLLAYASGVELNTPTSMVPLNLAPQGKDEYGSISFPAHLIAKAAGAVGDAPIIGKFARATEMMFSAISNVASIFGYSRPRAVPEQLVLTRNFGELAVTNFPDTSLSLALDSKKELTIDPRVVGLAPVDEMSFLSIATREAYAGRFTWSEANATSDHLWSQAITPFAGMTDNDGDFHIVPMAMVALPFEFWKGSIEVRFQVVCSAYHRGRLRIAWDPDYVTDPSTFNVNYSTMLDISESTEITMRIGWGQSYDYLRTGLLANGINASGPAPPISARPTFANGHLQVFVVNPLTSPSTQLTDIEVNVFVKACEDFEVASPTTLNLSKLNVTHFGVRPPDNVIGLQQITANSPSAMLSRGPLPLFTDTRTSSSGVLSKNGFIRNGWLYNYSPNSSVFKTTIEFYQNPGGDADIEFNLAGIDYTIPVPPGGAIVTRDFDINLSPGWTRTPFTIGQDSGSDNQVGTVKMQVPGDAQFVALTPPLLQPLCSPAVNLGTQGGEPTITPVSPGVVVITLPDFYPGTFVNVITLGETVVTGATPGTSPVTPVSSGHIQSLVPGVDGKITITGTGLWNIRSINYLKKNVNLVPQGQAEELNAESDDVNAPESMSPDVTMGPSSIVRGLNDIYFGERAESVRTILKRFESWLSIDAPDGTTPASSFNVTIDHYPNIPIVAVGGTWAAASRTDMTVFNLFSSAYVCMRGGMRIKLSVGRTVSGVLQERYSITRNTTDEDVPFSLVTISDSAMPYRPSRWRGTATDTATVKPYHEFELPSYSNLRFTSGRCRRSFIRADYIEKPTYVLESHQANTNNRISVNYAVAEDFSLSFFLSTPILRPIP